MDACNIQNMKKILEFSQVLLKDFNSETCLNIENIEEVLPSILLSIYQIWSLTHSDTGQFTEFQESEDRLNEIRDSSKTLEHLHCVCAETVIKHFLSPV